MGQLDNEERTWRSLSERVWWICFCNVSVSKLLKKTASLIQPLPGVTGAAAGVKILSGVMWENHIQLASKLETTRVLTGSQRAKLQSHHHKKKKTQTIPSSQNREQPGAKRQAHTSTVCLHIIMWIWRKSLNDSNELVHVNSSHLRIK